MFDFVAGMMLGVAVSMVWMLWTLNRARRDFNAMLETMLDEIEQEEKQQRKTVAVRVEQHGDQFYLFNNETDEFIAQGHDAEEVLQRARRPEQLMNVVSGDPAVIARLRATTE